VPKDSHRDHQSGDHLHPLAYSDSKGKLEPTTQFPYDQIDKNLGHEQEEAGIGYADMSAALMLLLQWISGRGSSLAHAGGRAETLLLWLSPTESRFQTFAAIATEANVTRAALSKWMLAFRDQVGVVMPVSKLNSSRETYRKSQLLAVKEGRHASVKTKKRKRL
jgi:hypothetical protein